jgi:hypothetical protein
MSVVAMTATIIQDPPVGARSGPENPKIGQDHPGGPAPPPDGSVTHFCLGDLDEGADVAGDHDAPVTSPDQHKPANMKALRIGAVVSAIILLLMTMGNHEGKIEDIFLAGAAAGLILLLIVDWMLRRNGLRS